MIVTTLKLGVPNQDALTQLCRQHLAKSPRREHTGPRKIEYLLAKSVCPR